MTSTAAICMVKDEADIVAFTVGQMLTQVDFVIVADNGSTDDTILTILKAADGGNLIIWDDPDPAYRQSEKMTRLAGWAAAEGAKWIVPFDADEWWWSPHGRIADVLEAGPFAVAAAELYDHVHTSVETPDQLLPWRRAHQVAMPKVAFEWRDDAVIEQGNHSVTFRRERKQRRPCVGGLLAVHHYPYRSAAQFVRKARNGAAAYAAGGDSIRADFGTHWRQWGAILDRDGPAAVEEIFWTWYHRDDPTVPVEIGGEWQEALVYDPADTYGSSILAAIQKDRTGA